MDAVNLTNQIKLLAKEIGFADIGITDPNLSTHKNYLKDWLKLGFQAEMDFMHNTQEKRLNPQELMAQTKSIICVSLPYAECNPTKNDWQKNNAISSYAARRDYHKVMHKKLQLLADKITQVVGNFNYRAFCDSAPVFEKALALKAGIGWLGKYTCLLTKTYGSQFFLGELFTDLELTFDQPCENHCATCNKCIAACPTKALKAPYTMDAKLCIAYLTLEHKTSIPIELRKLIGQRIVGCDECQLSCPWNQNMRDNLKPIDTKQLIELFNWTEEEFLTKTQGTSIRRIGYERWLRNLAVALGNSPYDPEIIIALKNRLNHPSPMVQEHIRWALEQQTTCRPEERSDEGSP
jgi:epoxyqueuosine reductase